MTSKGKITIYVTPMKLRRIRSYCKEHELPLSRLFTRGAMMIVNSQPVQQCKMCRRPSVGKFEILVHDWNAGETKNVVYLCEEHKRKAEGESEVREL